MNTDLFAAWQRAVAEERQAREDLWTAKENLRIAEAGYDLAWKREIDALKTLAADEDYYVSVPVQ